ncbi:VOC family protein [Micromonospora chersina]|uniref:VOC family protein n=1 Tax=Micromonospora chersina TaxID=47854 RepID=UPI0037AD9DF1
MTSFPAIAHVAVTVSDLEVSVPWYRQLFEAEPVLDEDTGPFRHVVFALRGGMLFGLHEFSGAEVVENFDPRRPGLDHVAFGCADRVELEQWQARLDELSIKHGGIVDAHYGSGLSLKDPDGVPLEFFAPPMH